MFRTVEILKPGKLYKSNAQYVLDNLKFGIDEALKNKNLAHCDGSD